MLIDDDRRLPICRSAAEGLFRGDKSFFSIREPSPIAVNGEEDAGHGTSLNGESFSGSLRLVEPQLQKCDVVLRFTAAR